ncbi:MAG: FAD-binding oxidoreductase [Silvanigrellaceae bacterium]|nr:FAD-binding oxidoreductase [Silvanigrellaceae bacterium]
MKSYVFALLTVSALSMSLSSLHAEVIKDFSKLESFQVKKIFIPDSIEELSNFIKNSEGEISVKGGGFSQGGQIAAVGGTVVDMKRLNKIISFDPNPTEPTITVEAGINWRKIQEYIDPSDFSVKVMQSYNDFSVGGSLSVNVHGRYVGYGPIVSSVKSFKIITADGSIKKVSRTKNPDLFSAAIGGYGAVGIIVEVVLELEKNVKLKRVIHRIVDKNTQVTVKDYLSYFKEHIVSSPENGNPIMTNADLYPPKCNTMDSITWVETEDPLTVKDRMQKPEKATSLFKEFAFTMGELSPWAKEYRAKSQNVTPDKDTVVSRNFEASYNVAELKALNSILPENLKWESAKRVSLLQEYFIPLRGLPSFTDGMCKIFRDNKVNVLNVSFRHVPENNESLMSWSREESFALVIYYSQNYGGHKQEKLTHAKKWTQELIDSALKYNGTYYLPYQIYANAEQFYKAYPRACELFKVKDKYDPENRFSNQLWKAYYNSRHTYCHEEPVNE